MKESLEYLIQENYKYKGKPMTERNLRTMRDTRVLKSYVCECKKNPMLRKEDLDSLIINQERSMLNAVILPNQDINLEPTNKSDF